MKMATKAPVEIATRPYAVAPPTNLMNPDGFFVVNMGPQWIEASLSNTSGGALQNVRVYIEGISDTGVARTPVVRSVGEVPAGASFPVRFMADFHAASPGTARVSFIVEADGFAFRRAIKKIFVTRVDYDKPTKTYSVVMDQGTMQVRIHSAIMGPKHARDCCKDEGAFLALINDVTYEWIPTPPYEGVRGPFPYEDPWWKIAFAILAALLLAGALLYDYFSDGDLDGGMVSVSGTFDETDPSVSCCTDVTTSATDSEDWLGRGLYASVGIAAAAAIASDGPDLHYRGQEATPPGAGELTLSESVRLQVDYVAPPSPGRRFPIAGKWRYTRTTDAAVYEYETRDERENIHWLASYEVDAPAVHDRSSGPLVIRGRFSRPDGSVYRSGELYVCAVLVSTYGVARWFECKDHGMEFDWDAGDGWYSGGYRFRRSGRQTENPSASSAQKLDLPGTWYLFLLAQDVNTVREGEDPFTAAHTIGGFVLTSQLELRFDTPCQLRHDAVIQVV
jgi:hypothetical protein